MVELVSTAKPRSMSTTDTTTFFPDTDPTTESVPSSPSQAKATQITSSQVSSDPHTGIPTTPQILASKDDSIQVILTPDHLSLTTASAHTRTPTSGANVLFLGTTRSYFLDPTRPVSRLSYTAYTPLALRTLLSISSAVQTKHSLSKVYLAHRLGEVPVGEESIIVAVSAAHRGAAWAGAEELLEQVKERAEIWKREWFVDGVVEEGRDGEKGVEVGVWRDNRDSDRMGRRKEEDGG